MTKAPTIYADTVIGYDLDRPGWVRAALADNRHRTEQDKPVLNLDLPAETARALGNGLAYHASGMIKHADRPLAMSERGLAIVAMTNVKLENACRRLGALVLSQPDLADRFDDIARQVRQDAANQTVSGLAIEDEEVAIRAVIDLLDDLFQDIRRDGPEGGRADEAPAGED